MSLRFAHFVPHLSACVFLTVAAPALAQDDVVGLVNSLRVNGCQHHLNRDRQLKINTRLNVAARYVSDRFAMREALERAGYRADQSAVIHVTGVADEAALRAMLIKNYCATLIDPGLSEIGIARRGKEVAMIFAAPFSPPSTSDTTRVELEVLRLVNEARAQPRRCGAKRFAAVPPLTLSDKLRIAASGHAKDMALRGQVEHEGSDGSSPDERATRAGYKWKAVGENVAGGQLSAKEVVAGWVASPHHCENIMDPDFTQMGVAFVVNPKQKIGIVWAQEFGRPR